jgi:hypothetical protein
MKRIYRLLVFWILIGVIVPAAISFILYKAFSSVKHGVRIRAGDQSWIEPTFDQALKSVWGKKSEDSVDLESYVWIAPFETHYFVFKGVPRKFYIDGEHRKDLSRNQWCISSHPLQSGLNQVLIRLERIPPESPIPQFFWTRSLVSAESIKSDRLFAKFETKRVLYGLFIAKFFAILAKLNCVLAFLIPVFIIVYNKIKLMLPEPRAIWVCLFLLMAILRFHGLTYQLDEGLNPDERVVEKIVSNFRSGDLKPENYLYTPGFHYINALVENIASWVLGHDLPKHTIPRFLSASFSSLSCLLVLSIGSAILPKTCALIGSILFGFSFMPIQLAHFGLIEPTMVFFFLLGFRAIINLDEEADAKEYFKAGLASGLGVGIKQTAAVILIPFFFAYLFAHKMHIFRWVAIRKALLYAIGAVLTYLLLSPYTFIDFSRFLQFQIFQFRNLSGETHSVLYFVGESTGAMRIVEYLENGIGYPMVVAAGIGCILMWNYSRKGFISIVPITLLFFLIASVASAAPYHYPLLLCPFLAMLAAVTVFDIAKRMRSRKVLIAMLTLSLLIFPLIRVAKLETVLSGVDTRRQSSGWCYLNLPLGARIDYELFGPRLLIPVFRSLMIPLWSRGTWDQYMKVRAPDYVIMDGDTSRVILGKSAKIFPEEHEWFSRLRQEGVVVKEFSANSYGQYNPHITIYKIPKKTVSSLVQKE